MSVTHKPPTQELAGLEHTRTVVIPWGYCDSAGIVFYPRYYEIFDASTHAMLSAVGLGHRALHDRFAVVGLTLVETNARYLAPVTFDETLTVHCQITRLGRSSVRVTHRLLRDEVLVVEGWEARVWAVADAADSSPIKAQPIPEEVRTILQAGASS